MTALVGIAEEIKSYLDLSAVLAGVSIIIATGKNSDEIKAAALAGAVIPVQPPLPCARTMPRYMLGGIGCNRSW